MAAEKMEEYARRKEKLVKIRGNNYGEKSKDDDDDIDDFYINAIKAKLAVLGNDE